MARHQIDAGHSSSSPPHAWHMRHAGVVATVVGCDVGLWVVGSGDVVVGLGTGCRGVGVGAGSAGHSSLGYRELQPSFGKDSGLHSSPSSWNGVIRTQSTTSSDVWN